MRRLSRAFSRTKNTDKEKEAEATTTNPVKSASPPPPTYEEAEKQQYNVEQPSDAVDPELPSPEDTIAHLKILECFSQLKQKIASTDGLFGISSDIIPEKDQTITPPKHAAHNDQTTPKTAPHNDKTSEILTLFAEKRWQVYVSRAVDRFAKWRYALEPDAEYYTFKHALGGFGRELTERVNPEKAKPLAFDDTNLPPIGKLTECIARQIY